PGILPVPVEPAAVRDPAENRWRVLTEDHPRQVVPEPDGQCDPVPRITQGVPMAVDLPDMWQQVEGDGQLAAPDVGDPVPLELRPIAEHGAAQVGGRLLEVQARVEVAAAADDDAVVL